MAPRLSVNVNKVATVRNSRGGVIPSVLEAVGVCVDAGALGITVHPRADQRHITRADVYDIARQLEPLRGSVEYNIEGDPQPAWLDMVHEVKPDQATLVPVVPGEVTSQAGWTQKVADGAAVRLPQIIGDLQRAGIRVSLFIDADPDIIPWVASLKPDRVELYTEPFARAFERSEAEGQASFERYSHVAQLAVAAGLAINAGHDLDLHNLPLFRTLPHLVEVSIGHALISRAIFVGLDRVVREYLAVLAQGAAA